MNLLITREMLIEHQVFMRTKLKDPTILLSVKDVGV